MPKPSVKTALAALAVGVACAASASPSVTYTGLDDGLGLTRFLGERRQDGEQQREQHRRAG